MDGREEVRWTLDDVFNRGLVEMRERGLGPIMYSAPLHKRAIAMGYAMAEIVKTGSTTKNILMLYEADFTPDPRPHSAGYSDGVPASVRWGMGRIEIHHIDGRISVVKDTVRVRMSAKKVSA